jgi:hypothetical protein
MMVAITGNTFAVREQLKALGGRWDAGRKCWLVPDDKADQARALVSPKKGGGRRPRTCATCGSRINYGVYCGKCEYR